MSISVAGKVALVTGAGCGIGECKDEAMGHPVT